MARFAPVRILAKQKVAQILSTLSGAAGGGFFGTLCSPGVQEPNFSLGPVQATPSRLGKTHPLSFLAF